jgi:hypothetical protein
MEQPDFDAIERNAFVTKFFAACEKESPLRRKGLCLNQCLDFVGWQEGCALNTPEAVELLRVRPQRWLYDRTTRLLVAVTHAHPVFAGLLADCLTQKEDLEGDDYMLLGLGFWHSSVAHDNTLHVPEGFQFTPEERRVFGHYHLMRW